MSKKEMSVLIDQIVRNQKFICEVKRCVRECRQQGQEKQQLPTFAFEKASKYPWSINDNSMPVEGQKMVEEITEMIAGLIDNNLHHILSREFINISNQLLVMRDEINQFVKEQDGRIQKIQAEFNQNLQNMRKKMVIQQNSANKQIHFTRTRATGLLNSSVSSAYATDDKKQTKSEIAIIKKDIQMLRSQLQKQESNSLTDQKMDYLQNKLKGEMLDMKVKIEGTKKLAERGLNEVLAKLQQSKNKQFIVQEVKRAVKCHFKGYLQQMNICKTNRVQLNDKISKVDKGLQQYFANQMKPVWLMIQNIKRKQQKMQSQINMNNESFIYE